MRDMENVDVSLLSSPKLDSFPHVDESKRLKSADIMESGELLRNDNGCWFKGSGSLSFTGSFR